MSADTQYLTTSDLGMLQLQERILELEQSLDGWVPLGIGAESNNEFSRDGLRRITELARLNYIKNPLIKRGINILTYYVFGRGVNIGAKDEEINAVIERFVNDPHNQRAFFSPRTRKLLDKELSVDGNLFVALFIHPKTGFIRIGTIPFAEISEIIRDPNDKTKTQYYKRVFNQVNIDMQSGSETQKTITRYYRDILHNDTAITRIGENDVDQTCVIYHIKINAFSDWKFGVSEAYAAIDWARAYKGFLEDYVKIIKSLARFAWRKKVSGGAAGVAAARRKLNSTLTTTGNGIEGNPSPVAGSIAIETGDDQLDPIKTSGSTTSATEGKPIKLMVASAFGFPDTFFGDTDTGNLATAKSLDRPTEFQFIDRQEVWVGVYKALIDALLYYAVAAPAGALRGFGNLEQNEFGETIVTFPENVNQTINVDFPPILEADTLQAMQALVTGATFDGKTPSIINDPKLLAREVLIRLGFDDVDEIVDSMYGAGDAMLFAGADPLLAQVNESLQALAEAIKAQ